MKELLRKWFGRFLTMEELKTLTNLPLKECLVLFIRVLFKLVTGLTHGKVTRYLNALRSLRQSLTRKDGD